jgi:hypothetical protein
MTMKSAVSWDVTPCSLVGVYCHFGGINCLHLQGLGVSHASNQQEASNKQ